MREFEKLIHERVESGQTLRFERNGKFWPLKILRVSPVVLSDSGAQLVRLGFAKDAAPVGSSGRLSWQDSGGMLPADFLVQRGQIIMNMIRALRFLRI